jgi:hypothetical protein
MRRYLIVDYFAIAFGGFQREPGCFSRQNPVFQIGRDGDLIRLNCGSCVAGCELPRFGRFLGSMKGDLPKLALAGRGIAIELIFQAPRRWATPLNMAGHLIAPPS